MDYINRKIEEKLKEKGMKKKVLAEKIGKTPGWLNNVLRHGRRLKIEDFIEISHALEVSTAELLPPKMGEEFNNLSLDSVIKAMVRKEVKEYLIENGIIEGEGGTDN